MNFQLNDAKFTTTEFRYTEVASLAKVAKSKGIVSVKFSKTNIAKETKIVDGVQKYNRVNLLLTDTEEAVKTMPCSKPLSEIIRKALKTQSTSTVLGALAKLPVMQDNDNPTVYFLMQPAGTAMESFTFTELAKETVSYDELAIAVL